MLRTKCLAAAALAGMSCLSGSAFAYTVYVSNEKGNSISVIDGATLEVKETVPVGQRPRGIMLTKDGRSLLICASDDDTVQILDLATNKIVGTLPSGPDPELLNIHPSGSWSISPMRMTASPRQSISRSARSWPKFRSASSLKASA